MAPTIRVDNDVFKGLQELAEPFVDTPNTVIRKLLVEQGILQVAPSRPENAKNKTKRGVLTPQPVYEEWLLQILWQEFQGSGAKPNVVHAVIKAMKDSGILKDADFEPVSTSGEPRAENTTAWARNALKEKGYIKHDSPRGFWELTQSGVEKAKELIRKRK